MQSWKASVRDGFVVVVLRGDLDVTGAADAEAAIAALLAPGQILIIEISALDFMDCASLRALLRVQTPARRAAAMWPWPRRSRMCCGCWP